MLRDAEIKRPRPIKNRVLANSSGINPGADFQPAGLGIFRDMTETAILTAITRREVIRSIPAILDFLSIDLWLV